MQHSFLSFLFFLLPILVPPVQADTLILTENTQSVDLTRHVTFFRDPLGYVTLNNILEVNPWMKLEGRSANFNYDSATYWLMIDIRNEGLSDTWMLEVYWPFLDVVDIYKMSHSADSRPRMEESVSLGDREKQISPIKDIRHAFQIDNGKSYYLIIKIKSSGMLFAPMHLSREAEERPRYEWRLIYQGAFIGIMLVMALYNLFICIQIREVQYLFYIGVILFNVAFQASSMGYARYLFPDTWMSEAFPNFSANMTFIFVNAFAIVFLRLKSRLGWASKAFFIFMYVWIAASFFSIFVPERIFLPVTSTVTLLNCLIGIWVPAKLWREGYAEAKYFLIAWSAAIIGTIFFILYMTGSIPSVFAARYGQQIGTLIEVVLLSLSLGKRIEIERRDKLEAIAKRNSAFAEANTMLEAKVEEKTFELRLALTNLEKMYKKLQDASRIDSLTELFNRGEFNSRIELEWRRTEREIQPLSLIMMDIDHFKRMNDTYGHQAGDECLKHVSKIIKNNVRRASDAACRYGGEEFGIILANTNLPEALLLAERVRSEIENSTFEYNGQALKCTSSIGVVSIVPYKGAESKNFIKEADENLYKAKQSGRNCIISNH